MSTFVRPLGVYGTFVKGYRYRANRPFGDGTQAGDILVFVGGGQFSAHDEAWYYDFLRERDGAEISWVLWEYDPPEKPREDLEELGP